MEQYIKLFDLNEDQARAVERFHEYHRSCETHADGDKEPNRPLEWRIGYDDRSLELACCCGATLHLTEQIYVTIQPQRFWWAEKALAKRIADEMVDSAIHPHMHMLFDPSPAGFFTYLYGISKAFELRNMDIFPNGFPQAVMRRFVEEACYPDRRDRGFDIAMEVCGSDDEAFSIIRRIITEMVDEFVPEAASVNLDDEKKERMEWLRESGRGIAQESLFQSAMVTLPEDTFEQVRLHPSANDMHFGLGLYLRNKFVHSGLLWSGVDPDNQSSGALRKLIEYCIPELNDYSLVYSQIEYGALRGAYLYCMEVRGQLPMAELTKHYDLLLEAQDIADSNPYSILDDEHRDEWRAWSDKAQEKRKQYKHETLYEIWNFDAIRQDLGDAAAKECEEICLAASRGKRSGFMPSEIAYVLAGATGEKALRAFDWVVEDYDVVSYLPDKLFERRDLALRATIRRGRLLERAVRFQDDDEVVLSAVKNNPNAIKHASKRLQEDRRVQITAAKNAHDDLVFYEEPMSLHNDDDELVKLALKANGMNIAFASERVRGDLGYAKLAWENVHNHTHFGMYDYLSDELKQNLELAMVIARNCDTPPSHFPPIELADNDELGEALAARGDHYLLEGMTRRIKEKYMAEDELERWGRDPWWWHDNDDEEGA